MIDAGASSGPMTKLMLRHSPKSRVISIEPFPGNWSYFEKTINADPRVTLLKSAVSDSTEPVWFYVGKTVSGDEKGWESMTGYSSVGFVVEENSKLKEKAIRVESVRLDDIVGDEHVVFLKADIQGGEYSMLVSGERLLEQGRIALMFIEHAGQLNVLELLARHGYKIYDGEYLIVPTKDGCDLSNWNTHDELKLSTGHTAYRGWPKSRPDDFVGYARFFDEERKKIGGLFTDLTVVHHAHDKVMVEAAASEMRKATAAS